MKFLNRWDEGRRVGAPAMPADQQLSLAHSPHALVACLPFHYFSHQNGCGIKAKQSRGSTRSLDKVPETQRQVACRFSSLDFSTSRSLEKVSKVPRNW